MKSQAKRVRSTKYLLKECRICSSTHLLPFLSLDSMPIPNGFIPKKDIDKQEFHFPLKACVCTHCWLVQLTHVIPAEIMFKNYLYIPSTSTTVVSHFEDFAREVMAEYKLKKTDLVIDIGSNDGTLLANFQRKGIRILGIDPAENIALTANKAGIRTRCDYFTTRLATEVSQTEGKAKIITATNVIAHIHNLHDVMEGVSTLLDNEGVFIMEAPYLVDLVERNEFDTIYHEHLSYFSIAPLKTLFEKHGMRIIDVRKQTIHGGTVRVFVSKVKSKLATHDRVEAFLVEERAKSMNTTKPYLDFAQRVIKVRKELLTFLNKMRREGKRIAGYGAAAKGNVLLNYCKITPNLMDFVVDSIPYKQGKYTPGTHIPIFAESKLLKEMPEYVLILAWNFADEIIAKNKEYRDKGGRFIIPVPYLKIV